MPRRRRPQRHDGGNLRLRELLPRVGFDFADKANRAMLSGANSALVKEKIRGFAGDLGWNLVDEVLAVLFEQANAAVEGDPARLSDATPGEFWGVIKQNVPWASGADLGGHAVFSLAAALVVAHETYDAARPYERFRDQYGKLAEGVHRFSALLKQHHHDNVLVMSFYFDSSVGLPPDGEEELEEEKIELAQEVEPMDIETWARGIRN
ncbi:hypothetical protein DL766_000951 [Monosporascus sp. MC13-8B]|uniref:Uncharacterized protein n=1 Tax=Monosporascus cannonballus TaxID=155416 RepID=A0ABY0GY82_9PEZI|nr:hypothetical protein DL762_007939 [Monosporascus cannonballus]RYP00720.1 hypothetical protein DL763_000600 [Monosporascus cannonballus]RYP38534.1 hypothetical protein DL766_000951 [Monosporascus sp. MC13-8B]